MMGRFTRNGKTLQARATLPRSLDRNHVVHAHHSHAEPRSVATAFGRRAAGPRARSGLRHGGQSRHGQATRPSMRGAAFYFCSSKCREKFVAEPARYLEPEPGRPPPKPDAGGNDLHLPDASANPAGGAGQLPDLRHDSRAGNSGGRYGPQRRTDRHDAALLDRIGARGPGDGARNGRPPHESAYVAFARNLELDSTRARDAGRAVGGLAVLRAGMGLARQSQSQHVHPDRHGHGRRLDLQRGRDGRARPLPAGVPRHGRRGRDLLRGGGGDHRPRAARPGARAASARTDRRRDPGPARPCAEDRAPHPRRRRR